MNLIEDTSSLLDHQRMPGLQVVLFVKGRSDQAEALWALLIALRWPPGTILHALDASAHPSAASWFGVEQLPSLVALMDGSILAIEQGCHQSCADRLVETVHLVYHQLCDL
jgi:thioredoxin-like negative regulator of GroEL